MNKVVIPVAIDFGTDLSSRHRAADLRLTVELRCAAGDLVVIDLNQVRSVSHSFADELFAVLVSEHGDEWFRSHVKVENATPAVRLTILESILLRLECAPA